MMKDSKILALGALAILIIIAVPIAIGVVGLTGYLTGNLFGGETATVGPAAGLCETVPDPYKDIFSQAGNKFKVQPAFIAAIFYGGEHGNSWPSANGPWATSKAGAQGPFQFMPGTWNSNKQDGDGDGKMDVQNLYDASYGAANLLANLGAGGNTKDEDTLREVAAKYNGGNHPPAYSYDVYAQNVLKAFEKFYCIGLPDTIKGFILHLLNYIPKPRPTMESPGPTAIILHWSGGATLDGLEKTLEQRELICHLGIDKDGKTYQFMTSLKERSTCQNEWNSHGIGIEIVGVGKNDLLYNQAQFQGVVNTVKLLMEEYNIPAVNNTSQQIGILGHYQINPEKTDPSAEYLFKVISAVK